jgi:hypothetical protein
VRIAGSASRRSCSTGRRACSSTRSGPCRGSRSAGGASDYPPIQGVPADLLLVTHGYPDHNAVEAVGGTPNVVRSVAGTFPVTPVGEVAGVASEHDPRRGRCAATTSCSGSRSAA